MIELLGGSNFQGNLLIVLMGIYPKNMKTFYREMIMVRFFQITNLTLCWIYSEVEI